jgi:hypothetical protein
VLPICLFELQQVPYNSLEKISSEEIACALIYFNDKKSIETQKYYINRYEKKPYD